MSGQDIKHRQLSCAKAALLAILVLCNQSASALELAEIPDPQALSSALDGAGRMALRDVKIFDSQSFRLVDGGKSIVALISGSGLAKTAGQADNTMCFLEVVQVNGAVSFIPTIGTGVWEAETCLSVAAVGLIKNKAVSDKLYLAILYNAASPNASALEPVVFAWDTKRRTFVIDAAASRRASLAGASNLREIGISVRASR
jgi:hypothetical protein